MTFTIRIKQPQNQTLDIPIEVGTTLFVLGANGSGKSSLMQEFYQQNQGGAIRVSAHRQSWFSSSESASPQELRQFNNSLRGWDSNPTARFQDVVAEQRPRMAITQLLAAENVRARDIAAAVDNQRIDSAREIAAIPSVIKIINKLMRLSNLPIDIRVTNGEQLVSSKSGGPEYNVAELSDGERNSLIIAAQVLTAPAGTLFLIDEPERHLHRSIISPMLSQLFAERHDCAFIVSTHEVMLPVDHPKCQVLLVRGCTYLDRAVSFYDVDVLPSSANIDEDLKRDILGARRKILFVEGTDQSLDKAIYSPVFPNVSVIAKLNCRDVENAVGGVRDVAESHWVTAFGIVDGDGRAQDDVDGLKLKGVYAIKCYSVESIYYHPEIQKRVAERLAQSIGGDASQRIATAKSEAIQSILNDKQRLCERVAEKEIRRDVLKKLPKRQDVAAGQPIHFTIDPRSSVAEELSRFQGLIDGQDLQSLINRYPVRETNALDLIAKKLGFQGRKQYESAVITLLQNDGSSLTFVRALFSDLARELNDV